MATDLQRTSYNMMIYEVRDFCTALINTDGELICQNVGGVSHFVADLGVIGTDGMKRYGKRRLRSGRRRHHQSPGGGRPAPQQRRHLHALLPPRRAPDVRDGAGALDRCRRHEHGLRRRSDRGRSLDGGAAARSAQDLWPARSTKRSIACCATTSAFRVLARRHEVADRGLPPGGATHG